MGSSNLKPTTEQEGDHFYIAQFTTPELAVYSYYLESNKEAVIIDPVFHIQAYTEFLQKREAKLKFVCLTHYHADFLSGHNQFNVPIIMGPGSKRPQSKFEVTEYKDGDEFHLGQLAVEVIHTPGHTPESSCFPLRKHPSQKENRIVLGRHSLSK